MARVLIAGCGYVGEAAADRFFAEGWEVEGWTASGSSAARLSQKPYKVQPVDVTREAEVSNAGGDFDIVIHCVSSRGGDEEQYRRLYLGGATNLIGAYPNATLIFTGSTSVYGQSDGSVVDETSLAEPQSAKGKILRETEAIVLAGQGIVARLGGIHGPQRSYFLRRFLKGDLAAPTDADRFINQIHRDDIVAALMLLAARRAECAGQIYNVVADEPTTARDAHEWLKGRVGERAPNSEPEEKGRTRAVTNKKVSNRKLRALGWAPRFPTFQAAMTQSILPSFGF
jgi:nucleoside-diphosphate-sugar epimerase